MPKQIQTDYRYVIQAHHYAQMVHFDFMFENSKHEALETFQLPEKPSLQGIQQGISCRKLSPHRIDYLDYEGKVSGNRGSVEIWDAGKLQIEKEQKDMLVLKLQSRSKINPFIWVLHHVGGVDWYLITTSFSDFKETSILEE